MTLEPAWVRANPVRPAAAAAWAAALGWAEAAAEAAAVADPANIPNTLD